MSGLLEGIRVVEVATMVLVPSAAAIMADFGAEVIKVESPGGGDPHRHGHELPGMPISKIPYVFQVDNRNKKSIVLDLRDEAAATVLRELVATADVFTTNLRPAALKSLKLTYEDLKPVNPGLIHASATGFGERGREAEKPGYDSVCFWSRSGIENSIFPEEGWLGPLPYGSGDHATGLALLSAVMMALFRRDRTGEGSKVSTSLLASGAWVNSNLLMAQLCGAEFRERRPRENSYSYAFLYYVAGDGRKLKLTMYKHDALWAPFCRAMGHEELIDDARYATLKARLEHIPELIAVFDEAFAQHDHDYWVKVLEEHDIPHTLLPNYEEVAADPQMAANDVFPDVEDPRYGRFRTVNSPIEIEGVEKAVDGAAPDYGEHTVEILAAMNYSEREIEGLIASGAAIQDETPSKHNK